MSPAWLEALAYTAFVGVMIWQLSPELRGAWARLRAYWRDVLVPRAKVRLSPRVEADVREALGC